MSNFIHRDSPLIDIYDDGVLDPTCDTEIKKFHEGIGSLDLLRALRSSRQAQRPLSLSVQLPCTVKLAFCPLQNSLQGYVQRLKREIDLVSCHLGSRQRVEQFHLGGGTPDADDLRRLMSHLHNRFNFLEYDCGDYSVEVDLPHTDWSMMGLLREQGFNHVSIGVPDIEMDNEVSIASYQNPSQIHSLIDAARTFGYRSINVDLGYGRAWQTLASFALKVATIIELEPDRLSLFDYAHPPHRCRLGRVDAARELSSQEDKVAMRQHCIGQLTAAGYRYIGMGQFVRSDDDLAVAQESGRLHRNCQGFTRHGHCDHIGFGVAAISQIDDLYVQNTESLERYQQQLDMGQLATFRGWRCDADDQIRRTVVERLACDFELQVHSIEDRYDLNFRDYFSASWPLLEQMEREGLIELSNHFISILPAGRLEVDTVCRVFESGPSGPRH